MRVFNITDVPTKKLQQYGLLDQHVVVAGCLISPGLSAHIPDPSDHELRALQHPLQAGVIAIDVLPPYYLDVQAAASSSKTQERPLRRSRAV